MPPMTFRNGQVWLKGLEFGRHSHGAGGGRHELDRFPADALPCIYDGWCHVGCPIGALANPGGDPSLPTRAKPALSKCARCRR